MKYLAWLLNLYCSSKYYPHCISMLVLFQLSIWECLGSLVNFLWQCMPLIEKITERINSWTARKLSFASRQLLIQSVLYSIQRSWSSIFILPKKAIKAIDINLTTFCGGVWKRGGEITRYLGLRSVPQKKRMA